MSGVDSGYGNSMRVIENDVTEIMGDIAFFTIAIYVADATGYSQIFLPVSARTESKMWQVLRMSALIGSYIEIRRWLEMWGWDTNLVRMLAGYIV